jgi:hypothetical protein
VLDVDLGVPQSLPVVVTVGNDLYAAVTDNDGEATIDDGTAVAPGADAVLYLDVNNNGQVDNVDVLLATATCPAPDNNVIALASPTGLRGIRPRLIPLVVSSESGSAPSRVAVAVRPCGHKESSGEVPCRL